ncbi:HEAT repeat domain-containing protein [Nannocystaceae bacterium ST9]
MPALLWDVQEEHLGEAETCVELWEASLSSAIYTLAEVGAGPEERLMAHTQGMVIAGHPVLERLIRPVLDRELNEDRFRTAAAALTLLDGGGRDGPDRVLAYFPKARAHGWWGLIRATHLSRRTDLAERILAEIEPLDGLPLAGRLEVLAGLGVDTGKPLRKWLHHGHPAIRRVAARLARHSSSSKILRQLLPMLRDPDPWLREAAIESALIRGLPGSWEAACDTAFARDTPASLRRSALAWIAMQGDAEVHARLFDLLESRPSPDLLWAAAISGRPEAVVLALDLLDHPKLARLAGEVVTHVAGLSTHDHRFWLDEGAAGGYGASASEALPPLARDDLDANLVPPELLRLRRPDPERIREWWRAVEGYFSPAWRYLAGRPLDLAAMRAGLNDAPMRRRHPLALELAIRTAGVGLLDTRAPARIQFTRGEAIFASLGALGEFDFQGGFPIL